MQKLTERMQIMAGLAIGEGLADIGTDHAYIPIYLAEKDYLGKIIASDIADGPIEIARSNIKESGLDAKVDIRKGAGLDTIGPAEVSSVIIAGMGGELIVSILDKDLEKSKSYRRLILQPRTTSDVLRKYLEEKQFKIISEHVCLENGHLCEIICTDSEAESFEIFEDELDYTVGPLLISQKMPYAKEYLTMLLERSNRVIEELKSSKSTDKDSKLEYWIQRNSKIKEKLKKFVV